MLRLVIAAVYFGLGCALGAGVMAGGSAMGRLLTANDILPTFPVVVLVSAVYLALCCALGYAMAATSMAGVSAMFSALDRWEARD
jgi:uncharacterized membrane protein